MRYSRLRLRLAGWFALGMLLGLAVLDVSLFTLLRRRADARLSDQVIATARGLREAVEREAAERPTPTFEHAVHEALDEWPMGATSLAVYSADGALLGRRGATDLLTAIPRLVELPPSGKSADRPIDHQAAGRLATERGTRPREFTVVAIQSTAALTEDLESLAGWLIVSVPLVLLISLPAGYLLARRALAPFSSLASDIEGMAPGSLDRRLPVAEPPDELDRLADQVNRLLDRLAAAQLQTRRFLAQAAHQLRTPLTLIRGESDLAIDRPREADAYRAALDRISRASGQMSRRVDELFLLARAEAGERVPHTARVELDAVALEAVDLMRGRAQALGHRLELGEMTGVEVQGDEGLLQEAAVELLENACRHGATTGPVTVAVLVSGNEAVLEVASAGPLAQLERGPEGERLGLAIVRWIASAHGGRLQFAHVGATNLFRVSFPLPAPAAD